MIGKQSRERVLALLLVLKNELIFSISLFRQGFKRKESWELLCL